MPHNHKDPIPVLILTGLSGSGKSHTMKILEDVGYETIDNLPLSLLESVITADRPHPAPLAIDTDSRSRDFSAEALLETLNRLKTNPSQ